jgi:hypothetical protein
MKNKKAYIVGLLMLLSVIIIIVIIISTQGFGKVDKKQSHLFEQRDSIAEEQKVNEIIKKDEQSSSDFKYEDNNTELDDQPWTKVSTCQTMVEDFIKERLSHPDEDEMVGVAIRPISGEQASQVIGECISENSFGVKGHVKFSCVLEFKGGDVHDQSSWSCTNIELHEK